MEKLVTLLNLLKKSTTYKKISPGHVPRCAICTLRLWVWLRIYNIIYKSIYNILQYCSTFVLYLSAVYYGCVYCLWKWDAKPALLLQGRIPEQVLQGNESQVHSIRVQGVPRWYCRCRRGRPLNLWLQSPLKWCDRTPLSITLVTKYSRVSIRGILWSG